MGEPDGTKMNASYFLAIDGDKVGREIERLIISEELDKLSLLSASIQNAIESIQRIALEQGSKVYLQGGDNLLVRCTGLDFLDAFLHQRNTFPCTFSVGIGRSARNSYLALKLAKGTLAGTIILCEEIAGSVSFRQIA